MGSCSKLNSGSLSIRTRRSKPCKSQNSSRLVDDSGRIGPCTSISEKLEALKQLIPANNGEIKVDQLFQETADYIVLLRTQVFVLQKLVDFYGSTTDQSLDNQNPV
ncbi:transcription factor UPBEAT1-like [Nicotiana tomentosiformis]|uniref:transcription factor UPBEAT1-like n=1 Tax=Nicotiana tomentosiformis TaxID=4098 RepID=UPI00051B923C|nr:transcription factor UPBEAT1-like [Nicotiana tomentosiformis]